MIAIIINIICCSHALCFLHNVFNPLAAPCYGGKARTASHPVTCSDGGRCHASMPLNSIWARLLPTDNLETTRRYKFVSSQPLMTHCCGHLPHRASTRDQVLSSHSWMCFSPCHSISSFPAKQPPTRQSPLMNPHLTPTVFPDPQ